MFSNGTEAMDWQSRNCGNCWKYRHDSKIVEREKCICKIEFEIETNQMSKRTDEITNKPNCPYRQEKRKVYKRIKKDREPLTLLGGIL